MAMGMGTAHPHNFTFVQKMTLVKHGTLVYIVVTE